MGRIAVDFGLAYIGLTVLLLGVALALEALLKADIGNFGTLVTLVAASWYAGHRYGRRRGLPPESGTSWLAALVMMLVSVLYSMVAVGIAVAIEGAGFVNIFRDVFGSIPLGFLIVVVVVVLAFYIVIPRI
ncbi:MAG: ABZJ_00895 family protein, partial [Pseudomonadota bacterium]